MASNKINSFSEFQTTIESLLDYIDRQKSIFIIEHAVSEVGFLSKYLFRTLIRLSHETSSK